MRTFKDAKGREWQFSVDVAVIKRLRTSIQFDLAGPDALATVKRLIEDPILTCDVVYAILQPVLEARGLSQEEFWSGMAGDPIEDALKALLEEITDFTPNRPARERLRLLLQTMGEMVRVKDAQADVSVKTVVEKGLAWAARAEATPGGGSGSSPEPSASIPPA